jgi:hypothetical protein
LVRIRGGHDHNTITNQYICRYQSTPGKSTAIGVDRRPSTELLGGHKERMHGIRKKESKPAVLKQNTLSFSVDFPKSDLLCFNFTVTILNNKTRLPYMLIDSGALHSFIDERFVRILGLVPRVSGSRVVTTAGGCSEGLPR